MFEPLLGLLNRGYAGQRSDLYRKIRRRVPMLTTGLRSNATTFEPLLSAQVRVSFIWQTVAYWAFDRIHSAGHRALHYPAARTISVDGGRVNATSPRDGTLLVRKRSRRTVDA